MPNNQKINSGELTRGRNCIQLIPFYVKNNTITNKKMQNLSKIKSVGKAVNETNN